jgi:prephenate dehydrogenase
VLPTPAAGTVLTDVGSTKRDIMAAAARHRVPNFTGGHPIAGSEHGGRAYARADLFEGRPWLLVHGSADASTETRLEQFVAGLGAIPLWLDASTHDRVIAYVSHVPQVLAVALMDAAAERIGPSGLGASGRAFAEMTRLASSPADLWEDILATNADFIGDALDEIVRRLPTSADLSERTWVRDIFTRAAAARASQAPRE